MMKRNIALVGFGTVGQGLCEILIDKEKQLKTDYDFEANIVAISDTLKGSISCKKGLDIQQCLDF